MKTTNSGVNWNGQSSGTTYNLMSVHFPVDAQTGYAVGNYGTVLKTTNGGIGVEVENTHKSILKKGYEIIPNPFIDFAKISGHESECFSLYDISGRKVGTYRGDRVGVDLGPGVYFLRAEGKGIKPMRIVKVR